MNDTNPSSRGHGRRNPASKSFMPEIDPRELEIVQLKEELAQAKDRLLRLAADIDNMRKRLEREKAEATLYAATNFARDLLSVADNMGRALDGRGPGASGRGDARPAGRRRGDRARIAQRRSSATASASSRRLARSSTRNMHQAMFESADERASAGHRGPGDAGRLCHRRPLPAGPPWWAWRRRRKGNYSRDRILRLTPRGR